MYLGVGLSMAYEMLAVAHLDIEHAKKEFGVDEIKGEHYVPVLSAIAVIFLWAPILLFFKQEEDE